MTAVLFDLDGTLYDDRQYVRAGFKKAAAYLRAEHGVEAFDDMVWEYCMERNFETVFDRVLDDYDLPDQEVANLVEAYHDTDPDLDPYPEVTEVLAALPDNCRTAVVTGGKRGDEKLRKLGLEEWVDEVYVTPDHGTEKARPDPFEAVLESLDVAAERAAFVGDNPEIDFHWPNRLGMTTVWVRRRETIFRSPESPENRPAYVLPTLSLVPEIVENGTDGVSGECA